MREWGEVPGFGRQGTKQDAEEAYGYPQLDEALSVAIGSAVVALSRHSDQLARCVGENCASGSGGAADALAVCRGRLWSSRNTQPGRKVAKVRGLLVYYGKLHLEVLSRAGDGFGKQAGDLRMFKRRVLRHRCLCGGVLGGGA